MRHIGYKRSGRDKEVLVPVWIINDRELLLLKQVLDKVSVYLPNLLSPDISRIQHMNNQLGDFLSTKVIEKTPLDQGVLLDKTIPDPHEEKSQKAKTKKIQEAAWVKDIKKSFNDNRKKKIDVV